MCVCVCVCVCVRVCVCVCVCVCVLQLFVLFMYIMRSRRFSYKDDGVTLQSYCNNYRFEPVSLTFQLTGIYQDKVFVEHCLKVL